MQIDQQSTSRFKYRGQVELPHEVIVRQPFTLRVILESVFERRDSSLTDAESFEIAVYLVVSPHDFINKIEKPKDLLVREGEKSSYVDFLLTPKEIGKTKISINFYQSSRYLGELDFTANVVDCYHE